MNRDYFSFFGIEPQLALDPISLQKRFYELSREWHPDRYARRPASEQMEALDNTALLNDAFRTLKDPVERAEYVLSRYGLGVEDGAGKQVPPELLEEVFEMNMALDELKDGDASVRPQIESAKANFTALLAEIDAEMQQQFQRWDAVKTAEALGTVRTLLNKRKYILNLVNTATAALGN